MRPPLFGLLLLIVLGATFHQRVGVPLGYMDCFDPYYFAGFSNVDVLDVEVRRDTAGKPVAVLRDPMGAVVIKHERDHVWRGRMMFKNCREYRQWLNDPSNRLAFEAMAYCTSVLTAIELQMMPRDSAYRFFGRTLTSPYYNWPGELSDAEAENLIRLACRERDR